jgi:hypothetical protein
MVEEVLLLLKVTMMEVMEEPVSAVAAVEPPLVIVGMAHDREPVAKGTIVLVAKMVLKRF